MRRQIIVRPFARSSLTIEFTAQTQAASIIIMVECQYPSLNNSSTRFRRSDFSSFAACSATLSLPVCVADVWILGAIKYTVKNLFHVFHKNTVADICYYDSICMVITHTRCQMEQKRLVIQLASDKELSKKVKKVAYYKGQNVSAYLRGHIEAAYKRLPESAK